MTIAETILKSNYTFEDVSVRLVQNASLAGAPNTYLVTFRPLKLQSYVIATDGVSAAMKFLELEK